MTYKKNFVAAIKVGGKILRESSDRVELPFGSEYSILLKNLDSVRMQARISIDGKDATGWLIVGPSRDIEVERFVKNLDSGNRFKFIELTERIEQHRGVKAEDGLVRVEFRREKIYESPKVVEHHTYHHHNYDWPYRWPYSYPNYPNYPYYSYGTVNQAKGGQLNASRGHITNTSCSTAGALVSGGVAFASMNMMKSAEAPVNDLGITVPGSLSNQKFVSVNGFETEQSEVVVLHLVGKTNGAPVQVAKTVQTKLECETCGKKNKSSVKFCAECGTSLERV
jgi:hypothetical protein